MAVGATFAVDPSWTASELEDALARRAEVYVARRYRRPSSTGSCSVGNNVGPSQQYACRGELTNRKLVNTGGYVPGSKWELIVNVASSGAKVVKFYPPGSIL